MAASSCYGQLLVVLARCGQHRAGGCGGRSSKRIPSRAAVREMACRENQGAMSFDKAAASLARTAQIKLSGEQLRLRWRRKVEPCRRHNKRVSSIPAWTLGADCAVVEEGRVVPGKTRVYTGCDRGHGPDHHASGEGEAAGEGEGEATCKCGQKRRPLPLRKGADRDWKRRSKSSTSTTSR